MNKTHKCTILKNARIVNEGTIVEGDLEIVGGYIKRIGGVLDSKNKSEEIDLMGKILIPGIIDDQVHFRDPGLRHKATIYSESKAGVAGGVTSFMEMPNTKPAAVTHELLEAKYARGSMTSLANFSFFLGASNDNLEEIKRLPVKDVCGVKIFMGSSTGDLLVDDPRALEDIFKYSPTLIATHCEDEATIRKQKLILKDTYGDNVTAQIHPQLRPAASCYLSSTKAIELAKANDSRLHILHISTEDEIPLFESGPLEGKKITAEVCVHHLWFTAEDYESLGNNVKCNPAIKAPQHRDALWKALLNDQLDIIATDHAPHTIEEKAQPYWDAPSGLPLLQHALPMMMQKVSEGMLTVEKMVEKMCHAPAKCFKVHNRGFIREGYFADLAVIEEAEWTVAKENIFYKCGWSPLEQQTLKHRVSHTFVNGNLVYYNGRFDESSNGMRLRFDR